MDNEYRRERLKEAWKILREEFLKDENERNENKVNHASYLIDLFAQEDELPHDDNDDFFNYVHFDINYFDPDTIIEYADKIHTYKYIRF
ncbi:MAG TPA: hypothetical protein GXZ27_01565 [Thermoanaerobacterales bacterium]|jgi:hypothetical protein|nr:hypothetical protein [Thermoanaerobacterales bacterium]